MNHAQTSYTIIHHHEHVRDGGVWTPSCKHTWTCSIHSSIWCPFDLIRRTFRQANSVSFVAQLIPLLTLYTKLPSWERDRGRRGVEFETCVSAVRYAMVTRGPCIYVEVISGRDWQCWISSSLWSLNLGPGLQTQEKLLHAWMLWLKSETDRDTEKGRKGLKIRKSNWKSYIWGSGSKKIFKKNWKEGVKELVWLILGIVSAGSCSEEEGHGLHGCWMGFGPHSTTFIYTLVFQ